LTLIFSPLAQKSIGVFYYEVWEKRDYCFLSSWSETIWHTMSTGIMYWPKPMHLKSWVIWLLIVEISEENRFNIGDCDLDLWPLHPKINKGHLLLNINTYGMYIKSLNSTSYPRSSSCVVESNIVRLHIIVWGRPSACFYWCNVGMRAQSLFQKGVSSRYRTPWTRRVLS
jgi:hypothetical protein